MEGQSVRDDPEDAVWDGVDLDVGFEGCGVCWGEEAGC